MFICAPIIPSYRLNALKKTKQLTFYWMNVR